MKNNEIIAHIIKFGGQRFQMDDAKDAYVRESKNSASLHVQVPGHNWRVNVRATIVDDEVFFGIRTVGGGHGYGAQMFTDLATPVILDRYLEKCYRKVMEGIQK